MERFGSGDRVILVLHGIFGSARNWRSFARRWTNLDPEVTILTADLAGHGAAPPLTHPATLQGVATDVIERAGAFDCVVGHSFGGKVALTVAAECGCPVWSLDSPPGLVRAQGTEASMVLELLRTAPVPAPDRSPIRDHLVAGGIALPIANWLLTSAKNSDEGWDWVYDLDAIESMLTSYFETDLWPVVSQLQEVQLVHAGRSDRWPPTDLSRLESPPESVTVHRIADAGHWVHVDRPAELLALLTA